MSYNIEIVPKRKIGAARRISAVQLYAQRNGLDYTEAASKLASTPLDDILIELGLRPKQEAVV
ncbi:hypothetical protein PHOBOS_108 [Erwinia phage vB_EamM_Phobos]|uniref:hypothetical protein n=1 Tax=Erwinia phage vB_EamM_Phobos TaxID=1883377 RepID=UPI00081CF702|nr:hypothetical protein BIZ79_gp108 [Erwinia phage vB_EamM_Phobos]ANZ50298.1 hypothetical protein PHOBOS_108 [Erwinia phage vB_EamM_Phobos]